MARLQFAFRMLQSRFNPVFQSCPYCGSRDARTIGKKWILIEARECCYCHLIFRWPTDGSRMDKDYYMNDYDGNQATDIPSKQEVAKLKDSRFKGTAYDKSNRMKFVAPLLDKKKKDLLDFGCGWGYAAFQYACQGFNVTGFELDEQRAKIGRDLFGLNIVSDWKGLGAKKFDLIVCDHVLEHVYDLSGTLNHFRDCLNPGGVMILFVPNCSGIKAREQGVHWGPFIGESHKYAFTVSWMKLNLNRHGFRPVFLDENAKAYGGEEYLIDFDELHIIAEKIND